MNSKENLDDDLGLVFEISDTKPEDDLVSDLFNESQLEDSLLSDLPHEDTKTNFETKNISDSNINFEIENKILAKEVVKEHLEEKEQAVDSEVKESNLSIEDNNNKINYKIVLAIIISISFLILLTSKKSPNPETKSLSISVEDNIPKLLFNSSENKKNKPVENKEDSKIINRFESSKKHDFFSSNIKASIVDNKLKEVIFELDRVKGESFSGEELVSKKFKPRIKSINVSLTKKINDNTVSGNARIFYILGSKEKKLIKEVFGELSNNETKKIKLFSLENSSKDENLSLEEVDNELKLFLNLNYDLTPLIQSIKTNK